MTKGLLVSTAGILILLFQNCQNTKFSIQEADAPSARATATEDVPTPGNDIIFKLEPALAIRGMGCIQCHAKIDSNFVTDFGFQGNGRGHDYYFSQAPATSWWKNGGVYGDHGNNFNTMEVSADKAVFIPKAALPATVATATGVNTLGDYIRSQFSISTKPGTSSAQVFEKSSIYIGAPTESNLVAAFTLSAGERSKYYKNDPTAYSLSGLQDRGNFFQNNSVVVCEGDLLLRGPVFLQNLQLSTRMGCRLHVIGSVFIFGAITFVNSDAGRNFQITSTKSINLGLGNVKAGQTFCEPESNWGKYPNEPSYSAASSLRTRFVDMWTTPGSFIRQSSDPAAFGRSVLAEADLIQAVTGPFYDAACRGEGRNVSFERLVLNAPVIHSRYQGDVSGTLIAEFAVMSLGKFKFKFDPVFISQPIFPRLSKKLYLDVQD